MINPYNRTKDIYMIGKQICMNINNVKILRTIDYQIYLDYINQKYRSKYLDNFKYLHKC